MNLRELVSAALAEDLGPGDITTDATIPRSLQGAAEMVAKSPLVLAGIDVAKEVFAEVDRQRGGATSFTALAPEGADIASGVVVARVVGPLGNLLVAERTALNFVMRLSGIATNTRRHVDAAGPAGPRIVDTRKTTPLHRELEKAAVRAGGGFNHRHALYDGVLIKNNHIDALGSLREAVRRARAGTHHLVRVEVEVRTLAELEEALETDAEVLLLDNMGDDELQEAVRRARAVRPVVLEASGNMNVERISRISSFGLDLISVGGLIHHAVWADLSLRVRSVQ